MHVDGHKEASFLGQTEIVSEAILEHLNFLEWGEGGLPQDSSSYCVLRYALVTGPLQI